MAQGSPGEERAYNVEVPESVRIFVTQSPRSMWIADPSGTLIFENEANRKCFGVEKHEDIVGKYNIFRDEQVAISGNTPQIWQVFQHGGRLDFIVDYTTFESRQSSLPHPADQVVRVVMYAVQDNDGKVQYVVVQNEDYTDEWRARNALMESEARYREIVDCMSDWVWTIDLEGRIMFSNPIVERILGYHCNEITGSSIFSFVIPENKEQAIQSFRRHVEKCEPLHDFTICVHNKDGTLHYLETNADPITDSEGTLIGYRGTTRDATQRKQIEVALMKSEENFRTIFDHVPAAVIAYDRAGIIMRANAACERMFGFPLDELCGRTLYNTIVRPEDRIQRESVISRVFDGETADNIEWEDRRSDGSSVYVLTNVAPVYDSSGRISMGLSLAVDITERRLSEQRCRELEELKHEFYHKTILAATGGKLLICDPADIERIAGKSIAIWEFRNREDISAIRAQVAEMAKSAGMESERIDDLTLCVGEAAANAVKHADGGTASLHHTPGGLLFMVADHGPGISALALPEVALKRGHTTAVSLGMGYKIMIAVADKVYLATGSFGTTVAVEVKLHAPESISEVITLPDAW